MDRKGVGMTDAQLELLLDGLLAELETAIEAVRGLMPEDAEVTTSEQWRLKPEYLKKMVFFPDESMKEFYTVKGDYIALEPLTGLLEAWRQRIRILAPPGEE